MADEPPKSQTPSNSPTETYSLPPQEVGLPEPPALPDVNVAALQAEVAQLRAVVAQMATQQAGKGGMNSDLLTSLIAAFAKGGGEDDDFTKAAKAGFYNYLTVQNQVMTNLLTRLASAPIAQPTKPSIRFVREDGQ